MTTHFSALPFPIGRDDCELQSSGTVGSLCVCRRIVTAQHRTGHVLSAAVAVTGHWAALWRDPGQGDAARAVAMVTTVHDFSAT